MGIDFKSLEKLAEGKTKIIYVNPGDSKTVYMVFKDDITAGDGVKHDVIEGKALVDWKVNRDIFELLNRKEIPTHYISSPEEKACLVKKLDRKINLEVVARRVAAGSILKWGDAEEGTRYDPVIIQFHYKDDPLHDPMLDEVYIDYLVAQKDAVEYARMREVTTESFEHLETALAHFGVQLVDLKLEFGIIDGEAYVIDEVTGGSFRLWPFAHEHPNLEQSNILSELNPEGRLDKDTYRMGQNLNTVKNRFKRIAEITAGFKEL